MPPNRAAIIRRRFRQSDAGLVRAMRYLADVYVTLCDTHDDVANDLIQHIWRINQLRQLHLDLYRRHWSGTERGLYKIGEMRTILDDAQYIDDPYADVRRRRAERVAAREARKRGTSG